MMVENDKSIGPGVQRPIVLWPGLAALVGGQAATTALVNGRAAGQQRVRRRRPAIIRQRAQQRVFAVDVVRTWACNKTRVGVLNEVVVFGVDDTAQGGVIAVGT